MRSLVPLTFACCALFITLGCQQKQVAVAAPVSGPEATVVLRDLRPKIDKDG